jgi:ribosome-binding protein aMBF1 (putative translation factor)
VKTTRKIVKPKPAGAAKSKLSAQGRGSVKNPPPDDRLLEVFASNVRLLRVIKGLSQEGLADLSDLDRTYISGIERKLRNVSIRNIQRIADALQVDARILLDPDLASGEAVPTGKLLLSLAS